MVSVVLVDDFLSNLSFSASSNIPKFSLSILKSKIVELFLWTGPAEWTMLDSITSFSTVTLTNGTRRLDEAGPLPIPYLFVFSFVLLSHWVNCSPSDTSQGGLIQIMDPCLHELQMQRAAWQGNSSSQSWHSPDILDFATGRATGRRRGRKSEFGLAHQSCILVNV